MALTKQDLKDIKGIVDSGVRLVIDNFAAIVGEGFNMVDRQFKKVDERFDKLITNWRK